MQTIASKFSLSFEALSNAERASWTAIELGDAMAECVEATAWIKNQTILAREKLADATVAKARKEDGASDALTYAKTELAALGDLTRAIRLYQSNFQSLIRSLPNLA